MLFSKRVITFLAIFVLLAVSVHASVLRYLTLQELCINSTDIVEAEVVSVNSFYYGKEKPKIYTSIHLKILTSHKGGRKKNEIIEIIRYGGTIDDKSVFQLDEAKFTVNQKSLLFLKEYVSKTFGENYHVYGLAEGKFNLIENKVYRDNITGQLKRYKNGSVYSISQSTGMNKSDFLKELNSTLSR